MELNIAAEKDPAQRRLENSLRGWQINVMRSRIMVGRFQEDIVTGQAQELDEVLAAELVQLLDYVKPTYDSEAEISEVGPDLVNHENGPSWMDKMAVVAHAFGVDNSHKTGTPEAPTSHDVLVALTQTVESVMEKGIDSQQEELTALRETLMKLSYGIEYYPAYLWH